MRYDMEVVQEGAFDSSNPTYVARGPTAVSAPKLQAAHHLIDTYYSSPHWRASYSTK